MFKNVVINRWQNQH
ncbi:Protein of unknown function [Lactobacillus helveticus CIRM-BIA 951]|uniref:Uncharacterized protein n=3 Tax=Lactobacillus helveticus TaxID=1587 RepID=U4QA26_LACHE|nr:Protein of unknown function [Lactobacillus helveticus CIRM-BIA 953]CDI57438.1 Protein of unknown function [Lactobacillus helveticus CIRM-BIA 951]CDI60933.1 Protein of unknown function [Lactobacillus helveticus CIRM-BIA 104]CDI62268.1 Protein of unknown function [Lactobacillus helveticus CIRM-BIA 103]